MIKKSVCGCAAFSPLCFKFILFLLLFISSTTFHMVFLCGASGLIPSDLSFASSFSSAVIFCLHIFRRYCFSIHALVLVVTRHAVALVIIITLTHAVIILLHHHKRPPPPPSLLSFSCRRRHPSLPRLLPLFPILMPLLRCPLTHLLPI